MEQDRLQKIKALHEEVGMQGDGADAVASVGFKSPQIISKALAKESWDDLTSGEVKCIIALHKILAKRKKDLAEIDSTELNR